MPAHTASEHGATAEPIDAGGCNNRRMPVIRNTDATEPTAPTTYTFPDRRRAA
ncbi:hypothetical protein [Actinoplanes philippinensis]|uniref:hypothetical protein n=1 Tax=Actinoplanes philippinensis TaxID=35752 RepID=UPI00340FCF05